MENIKHYKLIRDILIIVTALVAYPIASSHAQSSDQSGSYSSSDTLLVKFIAGANGNQRNQAHEEAAGRVTRLIHGIDVAVVKVANGSVNAAIQVYQRNPNVIYAEPNYKRIVYEPTTNEGLESPTAGISFNNFNEQWNLHNTGQAFGLTAIPGLFSNTLIYPSYQAHAGADINAPEAWDIPLGLNDVTIAILDTGVDCDHPDLVSKCLLPYSVVTEHETTLDDVFGHGSHVAGIAAASTDNGMGVAGVAPDANIASIKTCYQDSVTVPGYIVGTCEDADAAEAILHAVAEGYQVINMSFAGPDPNETLKAAIDQAWAAGLVMVAAAGNNYTTQKQYPAAYENVIGVGATDFVDNLSSFSTFSQPTDDWVSVLAPGTAIVSTVPGSFCGQPAVDCIDTKAGTSMASPHVAGLAALMFRHTNQPDNAAIREAIESSADTTGALGQNMQAWSAHGRIDMQAAITAVSGPTGPGPSVAVVQSITVTTVNQGRGSKIARAVVALVDEQGTPIANASIYGSFTGSYNEPSTASTNGSGIAELDTTDSQKGGVTVTFCVDSIDNLPTDVTYTTPTPADCGSL